MPRPSVPEVDRIKNTILNELDEAEAVQLSEWLEMVIDVRIADKKAAERRAKKALEERAQSAIFSQPK